MKKLATDPGERLDQCVARQMPVLSRAFIQKLCENGRVLVNDQSSKPGYKLHAGDKVVVDFDEGQLGNIEHIDLPILYEDDDCIVINKPAGVLTAARDPEGRPTIYDRLPENLPRLMPIGRLDMGSEGLLLLTNDGELKRRLELPATGWVRRYRVRVHGRIDESKLEGLHDGIVIDGFHYGPIQARLDRVQGSNAWLTIALREGKNREIRRVLEHFGWPVNRLIRLSFGPFQLGGLPVGEVEEVSAKVLADQLGGALAGKSRPPLKATNR